MNCGLVPERLVIRPSCAESCGSSAIDPSRGGGEASSTIHHGVLRATPAVEDIPQSNARDLDRDKLKRATSAGNLLPDATPRLLTWTTSRDRNPLSSVDDSPRRARPASMYSGDIRRNIRCELCGGREMDANTLCHACELCRKSWLLQECQHDRNYDSNRVHAAPLQML